MKKTLPVFCLLLCCNITALASFPDTTVKGVYIIFSYSATIFPDSWRTAAINANGKPITYSEIERTRDVAIKALNKYPAPMLAANLKAVYFLKEMAFFNTPFGGTNSADNLYLTSNGITLGYTNDYIEQTFHHEFSSILFRNHPEYLDTTYYCMEKSQRTRFYL